MREEATLAKTQLLPKEFLNLQAKTVIVFFDFFLKKDTVVTISMLPGKWKRLRNYIVALGKLIQWH